MLTLLLAVACTPSSRPIRYGEDACDYCRMTIVDRQHAAEAVTDKGKVYVFDAIECLIRFQSDNADKTFALLFVNDYDSPGELIDAASSTYLVSPAVPSPMGANLSGLSDLPSAEKMKTEKGGDLYNWAEIRKQVLTNR